MKQILFFTATLFFLCAIPFAGIFFPSLIINAHGEGGLFAQSTVEVENASVNYATKQVTFRVKWTDQSTPEHRNKVWIFVDYQGVNGIEAAASWTPATITGTPTVSNGTVSEQNARGFYLTGSTTNFESGVTVTLSSGTPAKFNWCAYATDYPPKAILGSNHEYNLHGTAPFVINDLVLLDGATTHHSETTITSFTDATGCPGVWDPPCMPGRIGTGSANCDPGFSAGTIG
jgi:hypothetical protein